MIPERLVDLQVAVQQGRLHCAHPDPLRIVSAGLRPLFTSSGAVIMRDRHVCGLCGRVLA